MSYTTKALWSIDAYVITTDDCKELQRKLVEREYDIPVEDLENGRCVVTIAHEEAGNLEYQLSEWDYVWSPATVKISYLDWDRLEE